MITEEEMKALHGKDVPQDILEHILGHFGISRHAFEKLEVRSKLIPEGYTLKDRDQKRAIKKNIVKDIRDNMILAYFNTDGSVNIAVDDREYYVFVYAPDIDAWNMVTYKEPSWYGINIWEKRDMALDGFDRKY